MSIKRELSLKELRLANEILEVYDEIPCDILEFEPLDLDNSNIDDLEVIVSKFGGMDFEELKDYVFDSLIYYETKII